MTTNSFTIKSCLSFLLITMLLAALMVPVTTQAQQAVEQGKVQLMDPNLPMKTVPYQGERLLFHMRTGIERAIVFPEPVLLVRSNPRLPGCDIVVDYDVVGFYPTQEFERENIQFVGLTTGYTYELGVRASSEGFLQPMRLTRQLDTRGN